MLQLSHLTKVYPSGTRALDDLSLEVGPGLFGLLGPNGAGKSTLMRMIATLQRPDSGILRFGEIDLLDQPRLLRQRLGYLPQEFGVYPRVSALRLLDYFAQLKGISSRRERRLRSEEVLRLTNLYEVRKKEVSSFSGGMKQRFGIAQLLLNDPELVVVDEPTAGLDPSERKRFLNLLREVGRRSTVIFSTHIVADVEELCQRFAVINGGRLLLEGEPREVIGRLDGQVWVREIPRAHLERLEQRERVLSSRWVDAEHVEVRVWKDICPGDGFVQDGPGLGDVYFRVLEEERAGLAP